MSKEEQLEELLKLYDRYDELEDKVIRQKAEVGKLIRDLEEEIASEA